MLQGERLNLNIHLLMSIGEDSIGSFPCFHLRSHQLAIIKGNLIKMMTMSLPLQRGLRQWR